QVLAPDPEENRSRSRLRIKRSCLDWHGRDLLSAPLCLADYHLTCRPITLPHLSFCSAISFANSAGETGMGIAAKLADLRLQHGSARRVFTSPASLSISFLGMRARAAVANPGTGSATAGTSGNTSSGAGERTPEHAQAARCDLFDGRRRVVYAHGPRT